MTDPVLEALWKRAVDQWHEDAPHHAFLEHCQNTDQLAEAAARYSGMAGDHERGESAKKRLAAITVLALAKIESLRASAPAESHRGQWLLIAAFIVASAILLTYLATS